jgi:hypothetical protein
LFGRTGGHPSAPCEADDRERDGAHRSALESGFQPFGDIHVRFLYFLGEAISPFTIFQYTLIYKIMYIFYSIFIIRFS